MPIGPLVEQPRVWCLKTANPTPPPPPGFALNLTSILCQTAALRIFSLNRDSSWFFSRKCCFAILHCIQFNDWFLKPKFKLVGLYQSFAMNLSGILFILNQSENSVPADILTSAVAPSNLPLKWTKHNQQWSLQIKILSFNIQKVWYYILDKTTATSKQYYKAHCC